MVSYSNDHLHVCRGRCHHCLGTNDEHETAAHDDSELFCNNCGRYFLQESCFESHKVLKLRGEYKSYCEFLCTLRNCDKCRRVFNLSVKCRHFGKKRKCVGRNVYFSDVVLCNNKAWGGGSSSYVKCSFCSDYYVRGFSRSHACSLRKSDSLFGDE